jgi:hypothetical protein
MFAARAAEADRVVQDHAAGLAVPRLIERDRKTFTGFGGPNYDLMPHQSIPLAGSITTTSEDLVNPLV